MSRDLEEVFRRLAPEPERPVPIAAIVRRARRRRRALRASGLVLAGAVVVATPSVVESIGDAPTDVARRQNASIRTVDTTRVDDHPVSLAYGHDAVWVATAERTLQRIDPATGEVTDTLAIGGGRRASATFFGTVATGGDAVWVTTSAGRGCRLIEIDPHAVEVVASQRFDGCYPLVVTPSSLWLGGSGDDGADSRLVEVDRRSFESVTEVDLGPCCLSGIAAAAGDVWVGRQVIERAAGGGSEAELQMELDLVRVDARAGSVLQEIPLSQGPYEPGDTLLGNTMSSHGGLVWVARPEEGVVQSFHAGAGTPRATVSLDALRMPDNPVATARWVAVPDLNRRAVALLDARTAQLLTSFDTGADMGGNAVTDGKSLWVMHPRRDEVVKLAVDYP